QDHRMKRFFPLLALLIPLFAYSDPNNGTLVIEGKYQNKNIYVQNSFNQNGVGFCAYEVYVNGQRTTDEVNSTAFEIDLTPYNLHQGDSVEIQIYHKDGCSPRVLNPEALKPRPTFNTQSITISATGLLSWTTDGESGVLPFIVEQYRWSKWVYVGEVQGFGTPGQHNYSFQVTPHSGENKFRVKQVGFGKEVKYSPEVTYTPKDKPVLTFTQSADGKQVTFSGESLYEMYDAYGNVVLKGYGTKLDLSAFDPGSYFLCFDNQIVEIKRK
ncbi:MAG TPA: hypothetical protein VFU15_14910, partial [Bacteroidia bacterium]|nr:hypothetical protein [Bacteroidia bacterium]